MQLVPSRILADRVCPTYQAADTAPVASSSSSSSSSSPSSQPSRSPPVSSLSTPDSLPPSRTYASTTPSSYVSFSPNEPEFTTPPLSPATPTTAPLTTTTAPPSRPTLKRMPSLQRLREAFIDHDAPASPPPPPPSLAPSYYYSSCRSSSPSSSESQPAWVPLPLRFKRKNALLSSDSSSVQARISRADPRTAVRGRVKSVSNVVQGGYGGADGLWSVSDDGSGDEDEEGEGGENGGDEGLVAGVKRIVGALTKRWWQRNEEEEEDEVVEECCIHSGAEARVDRFQELHCRGCLRRERGYRL